MPLRHFRRHRHLPRHQASKKTRVNRTKWVLARLLGQVPVSRVFHRFHVLSRTHHTKIDAGHVQTQHGVQLPAWSVHVRPRQHGLLHLNRININACIHNLIFNRHDLQLCFWRLRRRAALPTLAVGLTPTEGAEGLPTVLFSCIEHNS